MSLHTTWILRCTQCGEYSMGHGEVLPHEEPYVCGMCVEQPWRPGFGGEKDSPWGAHD